MADQTNERITVKANVSDIYDIWANFENFPHFMKHIKSVTRTGERTSHWVMEGPLGKDIEWDAETTRLEVNSRIAWNSIGGSDVDTRGEVTFRSLSEGETEITATIQYEPPSGLAAGLADLFGNPETWLKHDLERFKQYVETTSERIHESPGR